LFALVAAAAIAGDTVNYHFGRLFGARIVWREDSRFFKKKYLDRTHAFYEKYGAKTIVLARFAPFVRTFAPFVAGVGRMSYRRFLGYNVFGGLLWSALFVFGGYWFGNLEIVRRNFSLMILVIIVASLTPGLVGYLRHRRVQAPTQE
jgi:membrane-associated protein